MLLLVGTKLQAVITLMCLDSHDKSHVVKGTLLVRPSDHLFWFGRPKLLLQLLHFISFQVILQSLNQFFLFNFFFVKTVQQFCICKDKEKKNYLYMWLFESILNCILGFAELLSIGILHMDLGKHSLVIYCLNFLLLVCLKDEKFQF